MYNQKRRNNRNWIWVAIAAAAVTFVVILLLGYLGRANADPYEKTNGDTQVYEQSSQTEETDEQDIDETEEDTAEDESMTDEEQDDSLTAEGVFQAYYLVKYDNDVIRIYFSDQSGKITELEETTIVYETLSPEDQKRFQDGVKLESRDELNKLLMDYES